MYLHSTFFVILITMYFWNFFCIWRPYNSWIVFNMNYNLHACKYMYHTCVWVAVCWLAIDFQIHALITGPFDTPYEGGFFYFVIRCPPDYPIRAPRVKLITTGDNQVRFNPNLYKNGKVCLSILGYVIHKNFKSDCHAYLWY